jgi:ribonuclease VapC
MKFDHAWTLAGQPRGGTPAPPPRRTPVAMIVARHRNVGEEIAALIEDLAFELVGVTPAATHRIAAAHERRGKGVHPAGLNFGDCFSYEVAKEHACRLLYAGGDLAKTDIERAL